MYMIYCPNGAMGCHESAENNIVSWGVTESVARPRPLPLEFHPPTAPNANPDQPLMPE